MGKRKGKMPVPSYWRKNVAQQAQKRALKRQRERRAALARYEAEGLIGPVHATEEDKADAGL